MSASKHQRRAYSSDLTLAQWNILSPMRDHTVKDCVL